AERVRAESAVEQSVSELQQGACLMGSPCRRCGSRCRPMVARRTNNAAAAKVGGLLAACIAGACLLAAVGILGRHTCPNAIGICVAMALGGGVHDVTPSTIIAGAAVNVALVAAILWAVVTSLRARRQ